jgi:hypothetical protein
MLGDELAAGREGTAGVSVPDLFGEEMDEADAVVDRPLIHGIGRQEAVDVVGTQVGDHLGRRYGADLHVPIRIQAMLGEVVAQQIVVHRVIEGDGELEPLPVGRVALVLVLHREGDRLAVDVLDRRHGPGNGVGSCADRDGQGHRGEHVGRVVLFRQGFIAHDGPTGGLDHLDVEPVLRVVPQRMRHDDGRRAGDGDEADAQLGLLEWPIGLREDLFREPEREDARDRGQGRPCPDRLQEATPLGVPREERAHDGALDQPILLLPLVLGMGLIVLGLVAMMSAGAAAAVQFDVGIEGIGQRHGRFLVPMGADGGVPIGMLGFRPR